MYAQGFNVVNGDDKYLTAYRCLTQKQLEVLSPLPPQEQLRYFKILTEKDEFEDFIAKRAIESEQVDMIVLYRGVIVKINEFVLGEKYQHTYFKEKTDWVVDSQYREHFTYLKEYCCTEWLEFYYDSLNDVS